MVTSEWPEAQRWACRQPLRPLGLKGFSAHQKNSKYRHLGITSKHLKRKMMLKFIFNCVLSLTWQPMPLEWREVERGRRHNCAEVDKDSGGVDCVSVSININMGQKESRGARYGVMSGLISQPCPRLITQADEEGGNEKATWGAVTTVLASYLLAFKLLIRAHKPHLRFLITLLPFLDVPTFLQTCSQLLKCSSWLVLPHLNDEEAVNEAGDQK